MRIATFNVENLFSRVAAFNLPTWDDGKKVLDAYARVSDLLEQTVYTAEIKNQIIAGLKELELDKSDTGRGFVMIRQNRGKLVKRPHNKPVEIVAAGRSSWVGWLELKKEPLLQIRLLK